MRVGSSLVNHNKEVCLQNMTSSTLKRIQCSSLQVGRVVVTCVVCGLLASRVSFAVELALLCSETGTEISLALQRMDV